MLVAPLDTEKPKYVSGFAGSRVTLTGPRYLKIHTCGVTIVHPLYALDHDTPIIIGFDALAAARIIIDTYGRRAYSQFNYVGTSAHSSQRTVLTSPSPPVIFGELRVRPLRSLTQRPLTPCSLAHLTVLAVRMVKPSALLVRLNVPWFLTHLRLAMCLLLLACRSLLITLHLTVIRYLIYHHT